MPATPALESQLSSAEILWNMPGTAEEKATLQKNCSACHSWEQIFRNHYDEHSWGLIVDRMTHFRHFAGDPRGNRQHRRRNQFRDPPRRHFTRGIHMLVKFLTRVRGPDAEDAPLRVFPRPRGAITKVVITEYELPQRCWRCMTRRATLREYLVYQPQDGLCRQIGSEDGNCDRIHHSAYAESDAGHARRED